MKWKSPFLFDRISPKIHVASTLGGNMFKAFIVSFSIALVLLGAPFSFAQEGKTTPQPEKAPPSASPVVLGDQTLFNVPGDMEGFKGLAPEARAEGISEKIKNIAEDASVSVDSLTLSNFQKPMTLIVSGDKLLMVFLDSDAAAAGRSREELAGEGDLGTLCLKLHNT
jgi:hypothetical protein